MEKKKKHTKTSDLSPEEQEARRKYHREYMAEYYKKNREKMIKMTSENQKKNKDRVNAMQRKRREENRDKHREYYKKYNAKLRSPESQAKYEEKVKEGKDKTVGSRDEEWHKRYQEGLKKRDKK